MPQPRKRPDGYERLHLIPHIVQELHQLPRREDLDCPLRCLNFGTMSIPSWSRATQPRSLANLKNAPKVWRALFLLRAVPLRLRDLPEVGARTH